MSRLSSKKRGIGTKTPVVPGRARATHESIPRKPFDKSDNNFLTTGSRKLKGRKRGIARTLKLSSLRQKEISRKPARARRQKPQRTEYVKSKQEPRTQTKIPKSRKLSLSSEARALLAKVDEGGIPFIITRNLERIANEHGIEVSDSMTPNELIGRLRDFL
jgi:hypothetical protein